MTKEDLKQANLINEQIDVLNKFLKDTQHCWGRLSFFAAPKQQNTQVTLRTSYGWCSNEVSASERLSASFVKGKKLLYGPKVHAEQHGYSYTGYAKCTFFGDIAPDFEAASDSELLNFLGIGGG